MAEELPTDIWVDPFALTAEEERQMITEAVRNPADRQVVVETLREMGWTVTPPAEVSDGGRRRGYTPGDSDG